MRQKIWIFAVVLIAAFAMGCGSKEKLQNYINEPRYLFRDPHFADHKKELEVIEKQYLNNKITFAEYQEKKKEFEDQYEMEVQQREDILADEVM